MNLFEMPNNKQLMINERIYPNKQAKLESPLYFRARHSRSTKLNTRLKRSTTVAIS